MGGLHVAPDGGDAARLTRAFRDALRAAGYRRALVFPAAEDEHPPLAGAGVQTVSVGAEAFLDADDWTLRGKRRANLRQMVNRGTRRYGVRVREVKSFEAAGHGGLLHERWLSNRPAGHRMRLLIGTPCFDRPAARRYFIADQGPGEPAQALATLAPGWGGRGWGVDVMARAPARGLARPRPEALAPTPPRPRTRTRRRRPRTPTPVGRIPSRRLATSPGGPAASGRRGGTSPPRGRAGPCAPETAA